MRISTGNRRGCKVSCFQYDSVRQQFSRPSLRQSTPDHQDEDLLHRHPGPPGLPSRQRRGPRSLRQHQRRNPRKARRLRHRRKMVRQLAFWRFPSLRHSSHRVPGVPAPRSSRALLCTDARYVIFFVCIPGRIYDSVLSFWHGYESEFLDADAEQAATRPRSRTRRATATTTRTGATILTLRRLRAAMGMTCTWGSSRGGSMIGVRRRIVTWIIGTCRLS